jgi:hypothetical protein
MGGSFRAISDKKQINKKGTDLFYLFLWSSPTSTFHPPFDFLFNFINKSDAAGQLAPLE